MVGQNDIIHGKSLTKTGGHMQRARLHIKSLLYSTAFALTLSACGGGGGGGSTGISYSGVTSQASLTIANGEEMGTTSYQNGDSGQSLGTALSSLNEMDGSTTATHKPRVSGLTQTLIAATNKMQLPTNQGYSGNRAVQSESQTISGGCGGSATYTISVDDSSGDFSGTFSFSNYCDLGDVLDGSITIAGNIDLNTVTFGTISMTMTSLSFSSGNDAFTVDGSLSFNPTSSPLVITMDLKLQDNTTQQVFWAKDFTLTITTGLSYEDEAMAGRFYHPDYGYVTVSTTTPFRYAGTDEWPSSGVMVATGSGGSTSTLTALSNTTYQIDIDTDGDGNPDQTTTGTWSSL
jgi:hypothetical protein